jgi:hypothetical protein
MTTFSIDRAQARGRALALLRGAWAVTKTTSWLVVQVGGLCLGVAAVLACIASILTHDAAWMRLEDASAKKLDPSAIRGIALWIGLIAGSTVHDHHRAILGWWVALRFRFRAPKES